MSNHPYTGRFIWHELMTSNVPAAKDFYGGLFGWTFEDRAMGGEYTYTTILHGGAQIGGFSPFSNQSVPDLWLPYISTDDVDDFCLRAADMGATVHMQPTDIPGIGRFAVIADPQAGAFYAMTELDQNDTGLPAPNIAHSQVVWNELLSSDPAAAIAFYTRMFGWTTQEMGSDAVPYTLFAYQGIPVAGVGAKPAELPVSMWVLYFEVEDIQEATRRAEELGGTIVVPATPVENVGTIASLTDTTGASFVLVQSDPEVD